MAAIVSVLQSLLFFMILGASSTTAGSLSLLPSKDRLSLSAVGVIRSVGSDGSTLCSGTLVASDLVVTSAHCIKQSAGLLHNVEFVAGVNGTRFVANSGSVEVLEHPVWRQASGARKFRYDVAVVRLSRPIARGRVQPLRIYSEDQVLPKRGALVGYRGPRAIALHGRFDCALSSLTSFGLFASDCQVSGGNSGGAVLAQGNDGWELAGVIVASTRPKSMAVVVELDDWLRQQVTNALQREARQLMDIQSLSRTPGPLGL